MEGVFVGLVILFAVIAFWKKKKQLGKSSNQASSIEVQGKEFKCFHCSHLKFKKREGLLNTTWLSFFKLNFLNRSALCLVCEQCDYVHWFAAKKEL